MMFPQLFGPIDDIVPEITWDPIFKISYLIKLLYCCKEVKLVLFPINWSRGYICLTCKQHNAFYNTLFIFLI